MRTLNILLLVLLNSCVALSQEDLLFVDYSMARRMPDFELKDMNHGGVMYKTTDHPGATYVLEFYFIGCPACNQNASNYKRLEGEFKNNPKIQFLEIGVDCEDEDYQRWIGRHGSEGPVLNGCGSEVVRQMEVHLYPSTSVVNPDHQEVMRGSGVWSSNTYERMKRYLSQVKP